MIKEAHKKSIKVYAWVPQFHDRAALKKYPNAQMKTLVGKKLWLTTKMVNIL